MKNFFSTFFGAIVGVIVAGILCTVIFATIIVSSFKHQFHFGKEKEVRVKANSVLLLKFKDPIKERGVSNPFAELGLGDVIGGKSGTGLDDLMKSIKKAETRFCKNFHQHICRINLRITWFPNYNITHHST